MSNTVPNSAPGFAKYPGYEVTREAVAGEVVITLNKTRLCRSVAAIWVQETRHAPALYVPKDDVNNELLSDSATSTYCPFKGTASYYHVEPGDLPAVADVFWYYPEPYAEVGFLRGYLGFYQDRVSAITIDGAAFTTA